MCRSSRTPSPALGRAWRAWVLTLGLLLVLGSSLSPRPSYAAGSKTQVQKAEQLNTQAREAFKAGRFDEAVDLFMQVYDLTRTTTAVFNAARAREAAHKPIEAKALYELYLNIEKSPDGLADARKRLADIETQTHQDAAQQAAQAAAAAAAAKADADAAQKRLEADKAEAERQRLEKERQEAARAKAVLAGVTFLPPTGETNEECVRTTQEVMGAAQGEARTAQFGDIHPVGDYTQAEQARTLPGGCDFRCQMGVARGMGSAYALTTALSSAGGQWRLRLVLWRVTDTVDAGHVEVMAYTLAGLAQRGRRAAGEVFNGVRKLNVVTVPTPTAPAAGSPANLLVDSDPAGATVIVDDAEKGLAPLMVVLSPGAHVVRVQKAGFHARGGVAQVVSGTSRVTLALAPVLAPEAAPAAVVAPVAPAPVPTPVAAAAQPAQTAAPSPTPPPPPPAPQPTQPTQPARRTGLTAAQVAADHKAAAASAAATPAPTSAPPAPTPTATPTPPPPPPAAPSGSGLLWGGVLHLEGALATAEDPNRKVKPDASIGGGAFMHFGYGEKESAAWISGLVGARYFSYQGLSAGSKASAATPHGMSYWMGVAFPRAAGLTASFHYNTSAQDNRTDNFNFMTWSVRLISAKRTFYFAMGVEGLLASQRKSNIYDEFGLGPQLRIGLEMGVNIGAPLSQ